MDVAVTLIDFIDNHDIDSLLDDTDIQKVVPYILYQHFDIIKSVGICTEAVIKNKKATVLEQVIIDNVRHDLTAYFMNNVPNKNKVIFNALSIICNSQFNDIYEFLTTHEFNGSMYKDYVDEINQKIIIPITAAVNLEAYQFLKVFITLVNNNLPD